MMKKLEGFYNAYEELDQRYEANRENEDECKAIREDAQKLREQIEEEGEYFCWLYREYKSKQKRGNTYIDIADLTDERKAAGIVDMMRQCGIQFFTFSSGWSSSNEMAWELVKNGCQICGMMEINGKHQAFMKEEYEKEHGYLFRTF